MPPSAVAVQQAQSEGLSASLMVVLAFGRSSIRFKSGLGVASASRRKVNNGGLPLYAPVTQFTDRNLDDAARFVAGFRQARRPALQRSVLHRLEGAVGEAQERDAGYAFRGWAEVERLIVKPDNPPGNERTK